MTNLATQTDLEDRLGRSLTGTEATRAAAYLTDASALIRGYTNQDFTAVTGDTVTLRPVGTQLRLPQKPVTKVNSVTAVGWAGIPNLPLPVGFWGWDGVDVVEIAPFNDGVWLNLPTVELVGGLPDTYAVNYDHGDATVPDLVVAICANIVLRVLVAPSQVEGMSSERIGQYSYQMSQQVDGGSAGMRVKLTETDKEDLRQAGFGPRRATTIQLGLR